MKPNKKLLAINAKGFTILEVIVALFIFGCTLTAVMNLMVTGDKINGRRLVLSSATMVASNQIESIRKQEESLTIMGDTTYEETINGIVFEVRRTHIVPENDKLTDPSLPYNEYSVTVTRKNTDVPALSVRLLQGMQPIYGSGK